MSASSKPAIELAAQDAIEAFAPEVERVLDTLGFPGSLVTDESQVWDFLDHFGSLEEKEVSTKETLANLSELVARPVTSHDLLWEIARDLARQDSAQISSKPN